jgi:hypothetical protein
VKYTGIKTKSDEKRFMSEVKAEEAAHAGTHDFDAKQRAKWIEANTEVVCKRTDFPKLGYIIHRFNEAGIPSILWGESWHAPILRVHKDYADQAWDILGEKKSKRSKKTLDDLADNLSIFSEYGRTVPDTDLWE